MRFKVLCVLLVVSFTVGFDFSSLGQTLSDAASAAKDAAAVAKEQVASAASSASTFYDENVKDTVNAAAETVSATAHTVAKKSKELDEQYEISSSVKSVASKVSDKAADVYDKNLKDKVNAAADTVAKKSKELDEQYKISDTVKKTASSATDVYDQTVKATTESLPVLSSSLEKVTATAQENLARTKDRLASTAEMAANAAAVGATVAQGISEKGLSQYALDVVTPALEQIKKGEFYSNPECHIVPVDVPSAACSVDLHLDGLGAFALELNFWFPECSRAVLANATIAGLTVNFTIPVPRGGFASPELCPPLLGFPTPMGQIKPCFSLSDVTTGSQGLFATLNVLVEVPLLGRFPVPFHKVVTLGKVSECNKLLSCDTCTANSQCGWCTETNTCDEGTQRGDQCSFCERCSWFTAACPSRSSCYIPGASPHLLCGWCESSKQCLLGDTTAPFHWTCPQWLPTTDAVAQREL